MNVIFRRIKIFYSWIVSTIAFYPTIIFFLFILAAIGINLIEDRLSHEFLAKHLEFLRINNMDSARAILTTFIGGTISLTVFSFSMVMVLLNQASSNYTPRLLPGLISNKKNQFVLGYYLGSIVFNIIILVSLEPSSDGDQMKTLSILCGILIGTFSLIVFIFFIHTVSTSIQIDYILKNIFTNSKNRLLYLIDISSKDDIEFEKNTVSWHIINSDKPGYFQGLTKKEALEIAEKYETDIEFIPFQGEFLLKGMPLARTKSLLNNKQIDDLRSLISFNDNTNEENNYIFGLKQITEVGLKAMSPGINDPGTAISTLDYLTELLAVRLKLGDKEIYVNEKKYKIKFNAVSFENLLFQIFTSYRTYCKHDTILMQKLIFSLKQLTKSTMKTPLYMEALKTQLQIIKEDFNSSITNTYDKQKLAYLLDT